MSFPQKLYRESQEIDQTKGFIYNSFKRVPNPEIHPKFERVSNRIRYFKKEGSGKETMHGVIEEYAQEVAKEAAKEAVREAEEKNREQERQIAELKKKIAELEQKQKN